jgi:hypothetical protein
MNIGIFNVKSKRKLTKSEMKAKGLQYERKFIKDVKGWGPTTREIYTVYVYKKK